MNITVLQSNKEDAAK